MVEKEFLCMKEAAQYFFKKGEDMEFKTNKEKGNTGLEIAITYI